MNTDSVRGARLIGAAFGLSALAHVPALVRTDPINVDEAYIAIMGRMQHAGGELFRTLVDRKPPIMLWAYRMLVPASWSLWPVHAAMVVLVAVHGVVIVAIARRLGAQHSTALLAGTLAILGTAMFGPPDAQASNFELWGMLPASLAVLCALRAGEARAHRFVAWMLAAGSCVGIATNTKQPYVFTLAVVVAALPRTRRRVECATAAVGLATVTVLCALITDWSGYWRWVWFGNSDYVRVGLLATALLALRQSALFALLQLPLLVGVAAAVRRRRDHTLVLVVCGVWMVAAGIGVVSGLRFFGHYYQQLVPPIAIAAAFGAAAVHDDPRRAQRVLATTATVWTLALWALFAFPALTSVQHAPDALVDGVRRSTRPDDRVLVWGRLPDASVRSRRLTSGRFVHHAYLTGLWANGHGDPDPATDEPFRSRWAEFLDDLHRDPPRLIVDATPIVDGWHDYGVADTPLADFVAECYRPVDPLAGLPSWRSVEKAQCR